MLDFFSSILSYIENFWTFFLNFLDSFTAFQQAILGAIVLPGDIIRVSWSPISACVLALVSFSVVKLLLGRSNV